MRLIIIVVNIQFMLRYYNADAYFQCQPDQRVVMLQCKKINWTRVF